MRARAHAAFSRSFGKNNDLKVPFWSTKDPGQQPFSFTIGQGAVIKARQPQCACAAPWLTRARRRGTRAWRRCRLARLLALPPPLTTRESAGATLRGARATAALALTRAVRPSQLRRGRLPGVGHHAQLHAHLRDRGPVRQVSARWEHANGGRAVPRQNALLGADSPTRALPSAMRAMGETSSRRQRARRACLSTSAAFMPPWA